MIQDSLYVVYINRPLTEFIRSRNVQIDTIEPDVDSSGLWTGCMKVEISGRSFEIGQVKQYVQFVNEQHGLEMAKFL